MKLAVIGGSDAGISAALRAREVDTSVDVSMIVADPYPNFSICGLPFYLSGEVADWHRLAHRAREEIEAAGVRLYLEQTAIEIDVAGKRVVARSPAGHVSHAYDQLVIATGATPIKPPIPGGSLPNCFVLHTMDECFALHRRLADGAKSAVIVGGGYIAVHP